MGYYQKVTVIYRCQDGNRKVEIIKSCEEGMGIPMISSSEQTRLLQSSSSNNQEGKSGSWWDNEKDEGWW